MKYALLFLSVFVMVYSCKNKSLPTDVASLNQLKTQKRSELRKIQKEITKIDSILGLDIAMIQDEDLNLVTLDTILPETFERFLEVQGNVIAQDELNASSETGGRIIKSFVKEGQYVKKGALLFKLDMESVSKQRAEVEKALELASQVFEKQSKLWAQKIGSELQYLEAKNSKERLEKNLETLDHQLTKSNVYAPLTGEIETLFAEAGETVGPGTPIANILSTRNLKIRADAPETLLRSVKRGARVTVKIPAVDYEKVLRISRIGSTINPVNRTFAVEVDVSNSSGLLKPNLLSIMLIKDFSVDHVISVPVNLVQQEVGGKEFIMLAENRDSHLMASKKYITTGEQYDNRIIIKTGVGDKIMIINKGARNVADGAYIKIAK